MDFFFLLNLFHCRAPAYERFKHLILPSVPSLILPHSYNVLEDFFKSTDTVVSMMFNRSEVCTLAKVKAAVQEMTKRFVGFFYFFFLKTYTFILMPMLVWTLNKKHKFNHLYNLWNNDFAFQNISIVLIFLYIFF